MRGLRLTVIAPFVEHLARGTLRPVIDRVFTLDEIVEAHRYIESGRQTGKIVIDVEGGAVR